MKINKKISRKIISLIMALLMIVGSAQAAFAESSDDPASGPLSVRALTDMGWWGQRVTGVVLEFSEEIDASGLTPEDFAVRDTSFNPYFDSGDPADPKFMKDQEVIDVFTVSDPQSLLNNDRPAAPGKYLVVMVRPNFNGGTKYSISGFMTVNPNQPTEITIKKDIFSTTGALLAEASDTPLKLTGPAVVNREIDQFVCEVWENPRVGKPLHYQYRLPDNYDPNKKYPLVVFFNGNGQGYLESIDNVGGGLVCDGTHAFWFGAFKEMKPGLETDQPGINTVSAPPEDVIFLEPQSTRSGQSTAIQAEQACDLIEMFAERFSVDTSRIYAYTLSAGSGLGWWAAANRPDLFAAIFQCSFMGCNQAQAQAIAEAELPMRLFQGKYDHLMGSDGAVRSWQMIVDAYRARGLSEERIQELIGDITLYESHEFEKQGPGYHNPGGYANQDPELETAGRVDRHCSPVVVFQNPENSRWLLSQQKKLNVSTTANLVKKGDYFDVKVSFPGKTNSNAVSLTIDYDADKFEFAGNIGADPSHESYIDGVTYLTSDAGGESIRLTMMIPDYQAKDLAVLRFRAKEDADFQNADYTITVTADYVLRTPANIKKIKQLVGSTNFTTSGLPGDTDGDGKVTLLDLSNIIDMFGVKIGDARWTEARFYDFNKNNEIDIADIVAVAKLIN